jgi:hypothetical protein
MLGINKNLFMQKDQKLQMVNIKPIFFKRMSFWIYLFVIANILMFFAFTQDFYVQKFYSSTQKNFKSNNENYKKEYDKISSEIALLDKTLSYRNADDCDNINNLKKIKTFPNASTFKVEKLNSIIKVKEIKKTLEDYYEYLDKTNSRIGKISEFNRDLNVLIPFSQNLTNICINYDRLELSAKYSVSDDFLVTRLISQINELELDKMNSDNYFSNISKSIIKFKSKNYSSSTMFDYKLSNIEKIENKSDFAKDIDDIVNNVQDFKQLVGIYQVVIVDNDNELSKIKDRIVASVNTVNNQNLLDNILKISF